jgi:hypothetical protein
MRNGHKINGNELPGATILKGSNAENIAYGYVKLYRSITRKAWYKKSEHVHLFCHLLLKASHCGYETWFNGASKILSPGQLVTGRKKLSEETGIDESKVERILIVFENEQQIEQQKTNTSRLITILNWNEYQKNEQQIEQQLNNDCTTGEQQLNTIQEGIKKGKKVKNAKNYTQALELEFQEFWHLYAKDIGRPKCIKLWASLSDLERKKAMEHVVAYVISTPDLQYRKNPARYLTEKSFEDKIIINGKHKSDNQLSSVSAGSRPGF